MDALIAELALKLSECGSPSSSWRPAPVMIQTSPLSRSNEVMSSFLPSLSSRTSRLSSRSAVDCCCARVWMIWRFNSSTCPSIVLMPSTAPLICCSASRRRFWIVSLRPLALRANCAALASTVCRCTAESGCATRPRKASPTWPSMAEIELSSPGVPKASSSRARKSSRARSASPVDSPLRISFIRLALTTRSTSPVRTPWPWPPTTMLSSGTDLRV